MSFREFVREAEKLTIFASRELSYEVPPNLEWSEPPEREYGDLSFRIGFELARQAKKSPGEVAREIAEKISQDVSEKDLVSSVEAHPSGFLNFRINREKFSSAVLSEASKEGYGRINLGEGKRALVEHTSVNPAGALHIGHLRNVALGDSLARIFAFASYRTKVLNYIDDSGLQVADVIVGMKHLGFKEDAPPGMKYDHYARNPVYVEVTRSYEKDPGLSEKRMHVLQQIENHDPDIIDFVYRVTDRILREQLNTCWRFGAYYDLLVYESDILGTKLWDEVFTELKNRGIAKFVTSGKLAGCWIVSVKGESEGEDKVLVRSNGVATYVAKDTPFAALKMGLIQDKFSYSRYLIQPNGQELWRTKTFDGETKESPVLWNPEKSLTPIDDRQARLQRIIQFILSELANKSLEDRYIHVGYAIVSLSSKTAKQLGFAEQDGSDAREKHVITMAGRKGLFVYGDDALDALKRRAKEETIKRNPDAKDEAWLNEVAEKISVAALRFILLKQDLEKIIVFDLEESLRLVGETGPYLLYTYARASSIVAKFDEKESSQSISNKKPLGSFLNRAREIELIDVISKFSIAVEKSVNMIAPKWIAHYSYELCEAFNRFYENHRVLQEPDTNLRQARLNLVIATQSVLKSALKLLGIEVMEKI